MSRPHPWERTYPPGLAWDVSPPRHTLPEHAARCAARFGDLAFLDYRGHIISFNEFAATVEAAAAGLLDYGLAPGEKVALYLPNTPLYPISFFGVLRAGGVVVNLSPLDAERTLAHKLRDSGARILITTNIGALFAMARNLLAAGAIDRIIVGDDASFGTPAAATVAVPVGNTHVVRFAALLGAPRPAAWPVLQPDELAVINYTGGTTGCRRAPCIATPHYSPARRSTSITVTARTSTPLRYG